MISCVIIDDEKPARDSLELMIFHFFADQVKVLDMKVILKIQFSATQVHSAIPEGFPRF